MYLRMANAAERPGTGARLKQWWMISMAKIKTLVRRTACILICVPETPIPHNVSQRHTGIIWSPSQGVLLKCYALFTQAVAQISQPFPRKDSSRELLAKCLHIVRGPIAVVISEHLLAYKLD